MKLNLWRATEYSANYYMDADTFVVGSLQNNNDSVKQFFRLHERLDENKYIKLGATQDYRANSWHFTFNLGVFVLKPNLTEFMRLIRLKNDRRFHFETSMAEQGFLNAVYVKQWFEIGFENNANLVVYNRENEYWRDHLRNIRVIHFTMVKPWACEWTRGDSKDFNEPCKLWQEFNHCSI